MRKLITSDIHGAYLALIDTLDRAKFNPDEDMLIVNGDICDGWPDTKKLIDFLMSLKYFKGTIGNHDQFFVEWLKDETADFLWTSQGGDATIKSYATTSYKELEEHLAFMNSLHNYLVVDNTLIVHGGIELGVPIENQSIYDMAWDRELICNCLYDYLCDLPADSIKPYDRIILGHTQTNSFKYFMDKWTIPGVKSLDTSLPFHYNGVWDIDTGAGWDGKLTVMDLDTEEYWQSELVNSYYPNEKGR